MADSHKTTGQHMHQETTDELGRLQWHDAVFVVAVVFIVEPHLVVIHLDQALITDCNTMTVACQIANDAVRMIEAGFAIHHPVCCMS